MLDEGGHAYEQARSELALGAVLRAAGDYNGAHAQLDQCLPVLERLEAVLDLGQAHELAAALGENNNPV